MQSNLSSILTTTWVNNFENSKSAENQHLYNKKIIFKINIPSKY